MKIDDTVIIKIENQMITLVVFKIEGEIVSAKNTNKIVTAPIDKFTKV